MKKILLRWMGIFISIALFIYPLTIHSQKQIRRFENIDVDDGLSQNAVNCVIQDSQGFMWFGTHNGLNKHDGYSFHIYNYDPEESNSLSNNIVMSIYEDRSGSLWIGTLEGFNKFNSESDSFTRYINDPQNPDSLSSNKVSSILEDLLGNLWVGTFEGGLNLFDQKMNQFKHFRHDPQNMQSLNSDVVNVIFEDSSGVLWVGTQRGVNRFNRKKQTFTRFKYKKNNLGCLNNHSIQVIHEDNQGMFWVGTFSEGLFRFDKNKEFMNQYKHRPQDPQSLIHNCVRTIYEDSQGNLWIGTDGGLLQFVDKKGHFFRYSHDPRNPYTLSHIRITDIKEDLSGILWIATLGGGLNRINQYKNQFQHYFHNPNNPNSLSQDFIYPIFEDSSGILWIGTAGGGLNRYDQKTGIFTRYRHNPNNAHSLCHNLVRSISEDRAGFLWIGTEGGLSRLRKKNWRKKIFLNYYHDPKKQKSLSSNHVLSVLVDQDGILWVGTNQGLDRFDHRSGRFTHYTYNPQFYNTNNVWTIYEDREGILWLGTWGQGFNRFDKHNETFIRYTHNLNDPNCISHNIVTSFLEVENDILWIGTYGGGLNRLNRKTGRFKHYTIQDGLADNVVYGILADQKGDLWISTNNGLSKFNREMEIFRNYKVEDGLQSNEFNRAAYFKNSNGRMFFGGINGFNAFFPDQIQDNPTIPPMAITSFKVMNREVKLDWLIAQKEGIVLPYDLNFFSFEFAALDFTAPEKNQYAYMLEGVDADWIYSGSRRYAAYTSLNPGHYIFRIKGSNNNGLWNEAGILIPITISPPFWKKWWFTLIWMFMVLLILFIIVYFTFRHITLLKEKARAERFAAVGKFASYFAHDIKSPLEGTYLIASQMREIISAKDEKKEYLNDVIGGIDRMRNLVKGALDFSRASKPKLEFTDPNLLIQKVASEFQKINPCHISLELEKELPLILLDSALIKRVFLNLFENSFQARKDGCQIKITSQIKEKNILVEVEDNGKGIEKNMIPKIFEPFSSDKEQGHGFGLAFVRETIKSHGGTVRVKSDRDRGTIFFIKLPVGKGKKKGK